MGVFTYEDERTSPVPPTRLFAAFAKNTDTLLPKLIPSFKSVEVLHGTGGSGTVRKIISLDQGGNTVIGVQRVDFADEANCEYHYSIVGGNMLPDTVEKISYENKMAEGPGGGSLVKLVAKYHTKGDAPMPEEAPKADMEKRAYIFKVLEGYLMANPDFN